MKQFISKDQRGIAHMATIVVIVVVVVAGLVGWWVWKNNQDKSNLDASLQQAIDNAKCDYDDKDLCKFLTGWKALGSYAYEGTTTQSDGTKTVSTIKAEGDDKFYMKLEGATSYEIVQIGNVLYTKAADGTWWKQTLPENEADKYTSGSDVEFTEPDAEDDGNAVTYKKVGKEKCGDLTCFKYQVINAAEGSTTTYVWFDDKDYQLQRMQTTSPEFTWDSTYSYGKITVNEPSPVKELGPNQYIVPGQSEPVTLPSTGEAPSQAELDALMQQYQ